MKKHILFFCFVLFFQFSFSQKQYNNWYFGTNAGITFNTPTVSALTNGALNAQFGCTTWSDPTTGTLMFYTDGQKIWDKNHNIMPNGSGLLGHPGATQSALIVPKPGSSNLFYVFTVPVAASGPCRYNIVDMTLNGGLGDVVSGSKNISLGFTTAEKLTAIPFAAGGGFWVVNHGWNNNIFYTYPLTSSGIGTVVNSSIGLVHANTSTVTPNEDAKGVLKPSPDGTKLVSIICKSSPPWGSIELFDFNASTGVVTNQQTLYNTGNAPHISCGASFSPDNTKLYVTNNFGTYQYDMTAGSIAAIMSSSVNINMFGNQLGIQLGPDGKVYFATSPTKLGVINNPNNAGSSCNFVGQVIDLIGKQALNSLPNCIENAFNCIGGCVLGINGSKKNNSIFTIFPNPTSGELTIKSEAHENCTLEIYNSIGQIAIRKPLVNSETRIDLKEHSNGIYFVKILEKGNLAYTTKIVKQ